MSKYLDENGLLYFWQQLKYLLTGKVDKEEGKGLSTNDYTTADMTKLSGIEEGAEANIIESILVNGSPAPISSKEASITIPVTSVNGETGAVVLDAADVGALPDDTPIPQGTVTSVRVQATSPVQSSTSTAQSTTLNTTISLANGYGDTKNPYAAKNANKVLAGPTTGSDAAPSFRALVADDIPSITTSKISDFPYIPSKTSDLTNDSGYLTTETDPTVPSWAKASSKPSYSASEVGALPLPGSSANLSANVSVPYKNSSGTYYWATASNTPTAYNIAKYDDGPYLKSTTPAASDSSTKVATTAFVGTAVSDAISGLGSVLSYKGTKATENELPSTGNETGDIWIVTADNSEYVWNGSAWEKLGPTVDLSGYLQISNLASGTGSSTTTAMTQNAVTTALNGKSNTGHSHALSEITSADDLKAIEALTGTTGLLKKTAANTWTLDTTAYTTNTGTITKVQANGTDVASSGTANIPAASTSVYGVTKLSDSTSSTSTALAATANAVKKAYDHGGVTSVNGNAGAVTVTVPTKVSDLTNDSGFITGYTETDPVFSASAASGISSSDITNWNAKTSNTGTVTSVRVQATSPVQSSTSTAQSATLNTTISLADGYGDTKNPYASKTKNYVLAAPSSAAGTPSFRALVAADIPSITKSKISDFPSIPSKTSDLTNDSGFITIEDVPEGAVASTTTPKMNGTAAVGTETAFARGDHVHPTDTSRAASSHAHGNITSGGDMTTTAAIANGDRLVINDESASKLASSTLTFGTGTTTYLRNDGTWGTPAGTYSHPTYTAKTAAAVKVGNDATGHVVIGNALTASDVGAAMSGHTHGLSLATDTGTSSISLAANTKYKLTAGGSTYIFTTPADSNTTYSAGTGLSLSGTTFNHSNSVTASTAGTSSATSGVTLAVPYVTYDAQGHITATGTHTHTVPAMTASANGVGRVTGGTGLSVSYSSGNVTVNHSNSVTAGTAQGDASKTLTFGGTFTIPTVTYDAQGHVTAKGTTTMTMPANPNTDSKVTQSSSTTANWRKILLHAQDQAASTTAVTTSTAQVYAAVGISAQASTGTLRASAYNVSDKVTLQWNDTDKSLDFVFA